MASKAVYYLKIHKMKYTLVSILSLIFFYSCTKPTDPSPAAGDLCLVKSVKQDNDTILKFDYDSQDRVSQYWSPWLAIENLEPHIFYYNGNEVMEKYVDGYSNAQPDSGFTQYTLNNEGFITRTVQLFTSTQFYDTTYYFYDAAGYLLRSTRGASASNFYYSNGNLDSVLFEWNGSLTGSSTKYEYTSHLRPANFPTQGYPMIKGKESKNLESKILHYMSPTEVEAEDVYTYPGYTSGPVGIYTMTRNQNLQTYRLEYQCK